MCAHVRLNKMNLHCPILLRSTKPFTNMQRFAINFTTHSNVFNSGKPIVLNLFNNNNLFILLFYNHVGLSHYLLITVGNSVHFILNSITILYGITYFSKAIQSNLITDTDNYIYSKVNCHTCMNIKLVFYFSIFALNNFSGFNRHFRQTDFKHIVSNINTLI